MKKIILTLLLLMCLVKNNYSQTFTACFFINSPATCTTCCDGTFTITPLSCSPGTYTITVSNSMIPNITANGFEFMNVCYGTYMFTLTSNSCPTNTINYSVGYGTTTAINNVTYQNNEISVYPNPTTSILNISTESPQFLNSTIQLNNYLGQDVLTIPFANQIDLSHFSSGFYFLTIQDKEYRKTIKIIKQ